MKLSTKILLGLVVILLLAQFVRPEKNTASGIQPNDIFTAYPASEEVQAIAKKACYDCHSNNTVYPWYANVQPVAWWIDDHVKEGKRELNFSEFTAYTPKRARHKLEEVAEQVNEHEMPLNSYTWIHAEARLTDTELKLLADWAKATRETIPIPLATVDSEHRD
ncbi:MAG: heme-binding domain-containing protein [Sphingobacteriaceae bacterium]